ncbi:MAG: hypothetical protein GY862_18940, partial [Gammaproteobacteria bacterium]|nr:hypothetical protein [Gammaproteobacteria bacterium]
KSVENSLAPANPSQHPIDHNLAALLEPNPRKIKNFINSLCAVWNLFQGSKSEPPALKEDASEEEQREHEAKKAAYRKFTHRFMVFHYLRLYHKPVWRLLERQRWALNVLTAVLNDSISEIPLPEGIAEADQRLLIQMLSEAFAHVLKPNRPVNEEPDKHRNLGLSEAVKLFNERLDRKRSDEYFIRWYKKLVDPNDELPVEFLHLPAPTR